MPDEFGSSILSKMPARSHVFDRQVKLGGQAAGRSGMPSRYIPASGKARSGERAWFRREPQAVS